VCVCVCYLCVPVCVCVCYLCVPVCVCYLCYLCVCQESYRVCVLAVGSVLQLVDQVMTSELRNGFAVIR